MPYLGIFGLIFGETIAICEISIFSFVKMQSLMLKGKNHICYQKCLIWVFLYWNLKKLLS